jgi:hypothetical protein
MLFNNLEQADEIEYSAAYDWTSSVWLTEAECL